VHVRNQSKGMAVSYQSDQIGRVFAHWAIILYVWYSFFENDKVAKKIRIVFSTVNMIDFFFFDKTSSDNILGDFFTNSSGQPGPSLKSTYLNDSILT
jgi:hypothetical protein